MEGPQHYLEGKPTKQFILFSGEYINLSALARGLNMDHSYLSRIFSGERDPNLRVAPSIAAALGMSLDGFDAGIKLRKERTQLFSIQRRSELDERV